jgi:hypothetical protein
MKRTVRILFCLAFTLFALPVFAQQEDKAAKERETRNIALLTQIANDAKGLKLPENRAYVAARAGAAVWQADQKEARKLFDLAVTDLVAAGAEGEAQTRNKQYYTALTYGQEPRWTILNLIANCDASLAFEAMARTRTASLDRAIALAAGSGSTDNIRLRSELTGYGSGQFAINEIQNEQRLIAMAADQDPAGAIKLVRESLKKGVSYQTLYLLQKILTKDAAAANELTEDAIEKLLGLEFSADNTQAMDTMAYFLQDVSRERAPKELALRVPEGLIRQMVDKMINFWLDPAVTSFYGNNGSFSTIEKYAPDRAARVKQKFDKLTKQNRGPYGEEYAQLLAGDVPIQDMISRAAKLPRYMRNEVIRQAAQRASEGGNLAQAEKLIADNMTESEAENYLGQITTNNAYMAINAAKFSEANDAINRIPNPDQRVNMLVQLASSIYHKDTKANDKWALSVLGEARAVLPDEPETYEEIAAFFNIATNQAYIEPEASFRMTEGLMPMLNDLSQANATVAKLRNYGNFRQGEFQIMNGQYSLGVPGLENVLNVLKDKDFDRAVRITSGFTRLDARLAYQLQLVEGNTIVNLPINGRTFSSCLGE